MNALDNTMKEPENTPGGYKIISNCRCGENSQDKSIDQQETKYQCPMNCEGNKTYNQPGVCPICDMQLVQVGTDEPKIHIE